MWNIILYVILSTLIISVIHYLFNHFQSQFNMKKDVNTNNISIQEHVDTEASVDKTECEIQQLKRYLKSLK